MIIATANLQKLIESNFHNTLNEDYYEIINIYSGDLLTWNRFDLAFKLIYLSLKDKNERLALHIYQEHLRAFSLGKYIEPGNLEKDSVQKYIETFHSIYEGIKTSGFLSSKSIVPLSKNGSIANGAHRIACSIFLKKYVDCVKINTYDHIYDHKFFYNRNVPTNILDYVATKFVEYSDNVYIALIWPTAQGHEKEIEETIPNVVYRKDISVTYNGAHNLLSQIYYGEEWLGSIENNYNGSHKKLTECFKKNGPIRLFVFQSTNIDNVILIKEKIRNIFNVGKHSIHITDTKDEALRVARLLLNNNSVHFINHARPNKYLSIHKKMTDFKGFLARNGYNSEDAILDSGFVLSLYGLRECSDIDCFVNANILQESNTDGINFHDDELIYHLEDKLTLIYDPNYFFYFNDLKFVSFMQIYRMKKNRGERKDKIDCKIMDALLEDNKIKQFLTSLQQVINYGFIKSYEIFINFLKKIRLYNHLRTIVHFLKRKK